MPFNDEMIDRIGQMVNASPRGQANPPDDVMMAMLTDPRAHPAQRMAALNLLNAKKGGPNSPMAMGAAPAAEPAAQGPQAWLGEGAAAADKLASGGPVRQHYAHGGAVRGYAAAGPVRATGDISDLINKYQTITDEAPAVSEDDPTGLYGDITKQIAEARAHQTDSSKDKWMALLEGGLGTMAAASQPGATALGSIGAGGLTGIKGLRESQAKRAEEKMKLMSLQGTLAEHQAAQAAARSALAQRREDAAAALAERKRAAMETARILKQSSEWRHEDAGARVAALEAEKLKTKAADRREYEMRINDWKKNGGIFNELPTDKLYGFPNPQGDVSESEEVSKPIVDNKLMPLPVRTKLKQEAPKAQEDLIESYRALDQAAQAAKDLKNMPGKAAAIGNVLVHPSRWVSTESGALRTDVDQFNSKLKEVTSGKVIGDLVAQRQNSPRGSTVFGQLSGKELETALSSGTNIDPKLGDKFDETLDRHISNLESRKNALIRQWTQHYGALPKGFDDSVSDKKKDDSVSDKKKTETSKSKTMSEADAILADK